MRQRPKSNSGNPITQFSITIEKKKIDKTFLPISLAFVGSGVVFMMIRIHTLAGALIGIGIVYMILSIRKSKEQIKVNPFGLNT